MTSTAETLRDARSVINGLAGKEYQLLLARLDGIIAVEEAITANGTAWQPIETAPKNESVLIYIPNAEHYGVGVYRGMLVDMGTGPHWSANAVAMGRDLGRDTMPTHWMPLPVPPVNQP